MSRSTSEEIPPPESDRNEQETRAGDTRVEGGSAAAEQPGPTPDLPETGQAGTGDESGSGDASEGLPKTEDSGSDLEVSPEEGDASPEKVEASGDDDPLVQLEKARVEAADNYDRYLRAAAELDNFRKRAVRMRSESREETLRDLLLQIAPLMDNMRRALAQEGEARSLKQGVELILTQFQAILNGYGLEEIEAAGKPFDPNLHEAMLQLESTDCEPGTVLEEMEKGYRLRDKVLRPARVVVSKAPEDEGEAEEGESEEGGGE